MNNAQIELKLRSLEFAEDGETKIVEDSYEEPLKEIKIPELIHSLELEKKSYSRRLSQNYASAWITEGV